MRTLRFTNLSFQGQDFNSKYYLVTRKRFDQWTYELILLLYHYTIHKINFSLLWSSQQIVNKVTSLCYDVILVFPLKIGFPILYVLVWSCNYKLLLLLLLFPLLLRLGLLCFATVRSRNESVIWIDFLTTFFFPNRFTTMNLYPCSSNNIPIINGQM